MTIIVITNDHSDHNNHNKNSNNSKESNNGSNGSNGSNSSNSNSSAINVALLLPLSLTPQPPQIISNSDFPPTAITSANGPTWELEPLDLISNLLSPDNSDPAFSSAPGLYTDQDDVFTLPADLTEFDTSLDLGLNHAELVVFSPENNTFSIFGDAPLDHGVTTHDTQSDLSSSCNVTSAQALAATRENGNSTDDLRFSSPCCCLTRALGLMQHPPPTSILRPACSISIGPESCSATEVSVREKNPESQVIMTENQQGVKVLNSILQCPCSQDSYLLAILVVVVLKVLDSYEALAFELTNPSKSYPLPLLSSVPEYLARGEKPSNRPHISSLGQVSHIAFREPGPEYRTPSEDHSRIAAQSILRQLHHVQRVVSQLSLKLKSQGTSPKDDGSSLANSHVVLNGRSSGGVGGVGGGGDGDGIGDGQMKISSPFSASTLDHVEIDLRRRLRGLSIKIIDMLRQA